MKNKTVFICGCSPDLERPEIYDSLPYILDNYPTIGLNGFCNIIYPRLKRTTTYWYGQDTSAVHHLSKSVTPCTEKIIKNNACRWELDPERIAYRVQMATIPRIFNPGNGVIPVLQGCNSSVAAANLAFSVGAREVVLIGVDITKKWDYAFGVPPPQSYLKTDWLVNAVCRDLSKIDKLARLEGRKGIIKTNPSNKLNLEYRSIKEYVRADDTTDTADTNSAG